MGGCGGLERTNFKVSTLGGCGDLERSDFEQFPFCAGEVVFKELILNSFYLGLV